MTIAYDASTGSKCCQIIKHPCLPNNIDLQVSERTQIVSRNTPDFPRSGRAFGSKPPALFIENIIHTGLRPNDRSVTKIPDPTQEHLLS